DEPGEEARRRADDRAAKERDADERHEHDLRRGAEDVQLREDRYLRDGGDEQERRGLEAVGDRHGVARGCLGTSAATASSAERSASGCTWTVRKLAISLVPTATTRPIGIPYGYSSGYLRSTVPRVMIQSPLSTTWSFDTRSRMSMPPCQWRTSPLTRVFRSRAGTALFGSVSSVTVDVVCPTVVTFPTRPSALTTGVFRWMPEFEPAPMTICCENAPDGNEMTDALTARKSVGYCGPASKCNSRLRSLFCWTADAFRSAWAR